MLWVLKIVFKMGLNMRKPDFVACKQYRCRPGWASMQFDQCRYYLLSGKYNSLVDLQHRNFTILASLSSWANSFDSYMVGNPEDRFSRCEAMQFWQATSVWNVRAFIINYCRHIERIGSWLNTNCWKYLNFLHDLISIFILGGFCQINFLFFCWLILRPDKK